MWHTKKVFCVTYSALIPQTLLHNGLVGQLSGITGFTALSIKLLDGLFKNIFAYLCSQVF